MRQFFLSAAVVAAVTMLAVPPALSQANLTEAEIAEKFAKQKTRGLTIAPAGDAVGAAAAKNAPPTTTVNYSEIPVEEQVNINIRFDFDSAALREDQKPQIAALCNVLKTSDIGTLRIVGHTDGSGSAAYNEKLSLLRAQEVKRYLSSNCNVPGERLQAVGVGSRFLLDKADPKGEVNRRVEFQALS